MSHKATVSVTTVDLDIGKNSFHLIGLDGRLGSTIEIHKPTKIGLQRHVGSRGVEPSESARTPTFGRELPVLEVLLPCLARSRDRR